MKVVQEVAALLSFSNKQPPVYSNFHLNGWSLNTGLTVVGTPKEAKVASIVFQIYISSCKMITASRKNKVLI